MDRTIGKLVHMREALLPYNCALCDRTLLKTREKLDGLCTDCASRFQIDRGERCSRCGKPLISEKDICTSCRKENVFEFDAAVSIYPYMGRFQELLKSYKFRKYRQLGLFLADKLVQAWSLLPEEAQEAVWVPVPPRPGKYKAAGWDQVETLARFLQKKNAIRISRCLRRLPSKNQKELDRSQRRTNLQGKIAALRPPEKNIILFDDVFTTGSTLSACASMLKSAGAEKVWGLCLFYD